jgi:hypothetical protein
MVNLVVIKNERLELSKTSKGAGDRPPNKIFGHIESGEFAATCDIVREISAEGVRAEIELA